MPAAVRASILARRSARWAATPWPAPAVPSAAAVGSCSCSPSPAIPAPQPSTRTLKAGMAAGSAADVAERPTRSGGALDLGLDALEGRAHAVAVGATSGPAQQRPVDPDRQR